ncbi:MAG: histidinol phosphate phosphatase domain-containing protein [Anaerolineae bacterium]|nr:histidinol phosphate phosphatase domain-containing protein [Anaerolineae bacterium]
MDKNGRIDLHTHSFLSDGVLLPSEMLRRAQALGYAALAITDHVDASNLEEITAQLVRFYREGLAGFSLTFIPGVELTHVPPEQIAPLARRAKRLGIRLVVVHGETLVEPVMPGTNRAAVECRDVDILAHPGLITEEEAALAAANGVSLELSARGGHNMTNGHIARIAQLTGARLVVNTDMHTPGDMMDQARAWQVARGAGLSEEEVEAALGINPQAVVARALRPLRRTI